MTGSAVEQIRSQVSASLLRCSSAQPSSPCCSRRTSEQYGSRCCVSAVSAPSLSPPGYALPSPPGRISPLSRPSLSRQPHEPVGPASVGDLQAKEFKYARGRALASRLDVARALGLRSGSYGILDRNRQRGPS